MGNEYFKNSLSHILGELERIDLLIQAHFQRAKDAFEHRGEFHGLCISEEEVLPLLEKPIGLPVWAGNPVNGLPLESDARFQAISRHILSRKDESRKRGIPLRLEQLAASFGLDPSDMDILLLCLAPELSPGYERIYAYLQDDATQKKPTVDFVLNILAASFDDKMAMRKRLRPGAPLIDHQIIIFHEERGTPKPAFIATPLKVDERIVTYLLDEENFDPEIAGAVRVLSPKKQLDDLLLPDSVRSSMSPSLLQHLYDKSSVFYFHGSYGTGKKSVAEGICRALHRKLLIADLEYVFDVNSQDFSRHIARIFREARLQDGHVFWENGDRLLDPEKKNRLKDFIREIQRYGGLTFIEGSEPWEPGSLMQGTLFLPVHFLLPSHEDRVRMWETLLEDGVRVADVDFQSLSGRFVFSGGQIRDTVTSARLQALRKNSLDTEITSADLYASCRLQSNKKLSTLAQKLTPVYTWEDIVLPADRIEQLREICAHVKYRQVVFGSWGFDRKLPRGKGLSVLFSGPSGTGKTMSAEIMAADLGLDIYKIDLALVVSKYIGETEKNLSKIFHEAETSHAILFFDEADAIFGKRSEVHDAHDRYANIETAYLLQRMEAYEGVTILATNFKRNMDDAFIRRIRFSVDFPLPDRENRKAIWEKLWPGETPLAGDIDFDLMAGRFEITGGNIKNICLNAAFMAASDGRVVTMPHLLQATRREYQKMGKLTMGNEFA